MAYRNELGAEKSLVWITEIPFEGKPRRSSNFRLMGSEWYLQFSYKKGTFFHVLFLHREALGDGPQRINFKATTHVTNPADLDYDEINSMNATIVQAETHLWNSGTTKESILKLLPSLYQSVEIKIVCKFHGQPQSAFQLEIGTECSDEKSVQVSSEVPRDIDSLSSDFSRLLEKEILPDVKLECGGRTFRAHKSVLAARSEVFRAMFQNRTLESETGAVKIPDVDVAVLEKLLKFTYSGKPDDLSEDTTAALYEAADKYAVLSLKTACAYWIERNLTVENCIKYLKVSDSHSDQDLKAAVVSFVIGNPSVMKSEAWLSFSKELPFLANEVFQTYFNKLQ